MLLKRSSRHSATATLKSDSYDKVHFYSDIDEYLRYIWRRVLTTNFLVRTCGSPADI
jgi:hypothetical protein